MFNSRILRPFLALSVAAIGLAGCEDKAGVKQETTYTSPEGQTTVTKETKVESSGSHAPSSGTTETPGTPGTPVTPGATETPGTGTNRTP